MAETDIPAAAAEPALASCPFCGARPEIDEIPPHAHAIAKFMPDHPGSWVIECCCGCGLIDEDRERVIERWNRRVAPPEVVAALRFAKSFVEAELSMRVAGYTSGGDFSTLSEEDGGACGEAIDCLAKIDAALAIAEKEGDNGWDRGSL